jgi:hypothetical protein
MHDKLCTFFIVLGVREGGEEGNSGVTVLEEHDRLIFGILTSAKISRMRSERESAQRKQANRATLVQAE